MIRKLGVKSNLEKGIDKGASVRADKTQNLNKYYILHLRIHILLNEKIDETLKARLGLSKTAWILEAIQDKLKKEEN